MRDQTITEAHTEAKEIYRALPSRSDQNHSGELSESSQQHPLGEEEGAVLGESYVRVT